MIFAVREVVRKYDSPSTFKDSLVYLFETPAGEINRKDDIIKGTKGIILTWARYSPQYQNYRPNAIFQDFKGARIH